MVWSMDAAYVMRQELVKKSTQLTEIAHYEY